jgi:hypothetical protein
MIITFRGERQPKEEEHKVIFTINGGKTWVNLPKYLEEVNHSPTGFEWGYNGSGPAQLAYAILRIHCEIALKDPAEDIPRQYYQSFKEYFIAPIQRDEWEIDSRHISFWLKDESTRRWSGFSKEGG